MTDNRPIRSLETAPRNGAVIQAWHLNHDKRLPVSVQVEIGEMWFENGAWKMFEKPYRGVQFEDGSVINMSAPTHWKPLP